MTILFVTLLLSRGVVQKMNRRVLVVAAHPDDEVLGCGATIAKYVQQGSDIHVMILAEGITSREITRDREKHTDELGRLQCAAKTANDILGVTSLMIHDYPDNRMDSINLLDIIKVIENHIEQIKPSAILTHGASDVNIDHRRIHEAVVTACRPTPQNRVDTLLFFEIPSSTEWQVPTLTSYFMPNWFEDVSSTLNVKLEALNAYESELRPWPHPRSLKAAECLARWRGATIGVDAAEAFMLGRKIGRV